MKRALIVGVAGQDGYYLCRLLEKKGYTIYGVDRFIPTHFTEQGKPLSGVLEIELPQQGELAEYVMEVKPDEIYYLAAHHFSSQSQENLDGLMTPFLSVNLICPNEVLEVLQEDIPRCRFFYAASAHIFGIPDESPQTELTQPRPSTPYAISKYAALMLCRYYRQTHNIFSVVGILYNHESPRRSNSFVTTQIARSAAMIALGYEESLVLRDLTAVVDWGAAEDYVEAMWLTLQQPFGDEYIISSGVSRTVMDFAREAFNYVGLKAEDHVFQEKKDSSNITTPFIGDNSKIISKCGWQPSKNFESIVREMVDFHLTNIKGN